MPRTNFGKTRTHDKPYAIYKDDKHGWEWRVLKTYKHSTKELDDPYARWYTSVTSPMMHNGEYEYGDTYCKDVIWNGKLVLANKEWLEEYSSVDPLNVEEYTKLLMKEDDND